MKLGVLCSGKLGHTILTYLYESWNIDFVCTDLHSNEIIEFCKINDIKSFIGNPRGGRINPFLREKQIDVLISVNYLFIIDSDLIKLPKLISFNIHGSLLPKYRGRTPHVWAIINNEKITGITAHVIDDGCDTGDIIDQIIIPIGTDDTGATLLKKYEIAYIPFIDSVLKKIEVGEISYKPQNHSIATFFGKRTPEDGLIDWNWHKERIFNWIRALSSPYPGAFSYYDEHRIIIDEVRFSAVGFHYSLENGTILSVDPLIVKSPNGAIEIVRFKNSNVDFVLGNKFLNSLK